MHNVRVTLVEPRPWAPWKLSKRQRGLLKAQGRAWKEVSLTQMQVYFTEELDDSLSQVCWTAWLAMVPYPAVHISQQSCEAAELL